MLKVKKSAVVKLFKELGSKSAETWNDTKLAQKLGDLPKVVDDDTKVKDPELAKLLKAILKALSKKENIVIDAGKDKVESSKEKPKSKKSKKDEDEDEDEDDEDDEDEDEDEDDDEDDEDEDEDDEDEDEDEKPKKKGKKSKKDEDEDEDEDDEDDEDEDEDDEDEDDEDEDEDDEDEDEDEKPNKKGKKSKKDKKKGKKSEGGNKKPGVIQAIIAALRDASKKKPITKEKILAILVKKFPEREERAMKSTIASQIPSGLKAEKGLTVKKNEDGYWLDE